MHKQLSLFMKEIETNKAFEMIVYVFSGLFVVALVFNAKWIAIIGFAVFYLLFKYIGKHYLRQLKFTSIILLATLVSDILFQSLIHSIGLEGMIDNNQGATTDKEPKPIKQTSKLAKTSSVKGVADPNPIETPITPANAEDVSTDDAVSAEEIGFTTKTNHKLNYGASLIDSYKNLNKNLDPDSIKELTTETMKLMKEQSRLMDSLKQMTPIIQQAKSVMSMFDVDSVVKGMTKKA